MSDLEANFRQVGISAVDRSETIRDNQGHLLVELKDSFPHAPMVTTVPLSTSASRSFSALDTVLCGAYDPLCAILGGFKSPVPKILRTFVRKRKRVPKRNLAALRDPYF